MQRREFIVSAAALLGNSAFSHEASAQTPNPGVTGKLSIWLGYPETVEAFRRASPPDAIEIPRNWCSA